MQPAAHKVKASPTRFIACFGALSNRLGDVVPRQADLAHGVADLAQFEAAWAVVESVRLDRFGPEAMGARPQPVQPASVV